MIDVRNLEKSFGAVKALHGASFRAEDGRITGLLGPNGAGKTTALRILYTALLPSSGRAEVDGHDVVASPREVQARLGVVPHDHGLYPRLTAREHIRYFGRLHGLDADVLEENIDALIELLDMGDIAERRTHGFSQGQKVKVAIARALVHQPKNIVLDEPTSGLDVVSTRALRDFIRRLKAEGRCILLSSHIMQEVAALCDDIVIVVKGRVVLSGSPESILEATQTTDLEDAFIEAIVRADAPEKHDTDLSLGGGRGA